MTATSKQIVVLRLVAEGYSLKQIALRLNRSPKTIESHYASGMERMGFTGKTELIAYARRMWWVNDEVNCKVR